MGHVGRTRDRQRLRPFGYGIAAMAICAGLVAAPVHGVAQADVTGSESTESASTSSVSERTDPGPGGTAAKVDSSATKPVRDEPKRPGTRKSVRDLDADLDGAAADEDSSPRTRAPSRETHSEVESSATTPDTDQSNPGPETPTPVVEVDGPVNSAVPEITGPEPDSSAPEAPAPQLVKADRDEHFLGRPVVRPARGLREEITGIPVTTSAVGVLTAEASSERPEPAGFATALAAAASSTAVEITTPSPPKPLSPIAQLLELPGRLVNAVLEAFDFTSYANSPSLPIGLGPINDLIFGAFREVERLLGLYQTPPVQPAIPTLTYTGPTTRPTPTVAQFLNAATAEYVLGSTPGGLVPFTVDGFQLSSTNIFSGMVGKAWVTPEGQIIIAYQGTTGGTNLLFNPIITISQIIADLQVVFTGTTPLAFYDALRFANRVQAEAALQGYTSDDIFVTGHSLGGWEAQFVAQQTGLAGIGFEAPGINTIVEGNGADSMFVNIGTYGSTAPYMSTDLPGLQPFMPPYVPGGGSKPHYGPIVMIGDPAAMTPLYNASTLWGKSLIGSAIFLVDFMMNFLQYHLPRVQAYHLDVTPDPGVVPFLGTARGPVHTGYGALTIPQLMLAASNDGILFRP